MSNFKIKTEYIDKTVRVYDRILGQRSIVVAKIDMSKVKYYQSIGLSYLFEEVVTTTVPGEVYVSPSELKGADKLEVTVIEYKAVDGPIPAPKKKRKKKPSADTNANS